MKTELEIKRETSEKIEPEIKALIKKYGYDAVAYTWNRTVAKQRELQKAEHDAKEALDKVESLKRSLEQL